MDLSVIVGLSITTFWILIGFVFHNRIIFLLQGIWIILIGSFNTYSADWLNNFQTYQDASISNVGLSNFLMFFYNYLSVKARDIGMQYENFNMILSSISTLLIMYVIFKCSKNPTIVLSLILIFPFIDDIIQKRWYYAMSIMIFGIFLSYRSPTKIKRFVILLVSSIIAIQFHEGAIIFVTLPFFLLLKDKYKVTIAILVFIVGTIGRGKISTLANLVLGSGSIDKTTLYFSTLAESSTLAHYLFWIVWQMSQVLIIYYVYKHVPKDKYIHYIWNLNLWSICSIPLYSFDPVFSRIFRVIMIFNYMVIANTFWHDKWNVSKLATIAISLQVVLTLVSLFVFDLNSDLGIQVMIFNIFQNNRILGMFL